MGYHMIIYEVYRQSFYYIWHAQGNIYIVIDTHLGVVFKFYDFSSIFRSERSNESISRNIVLLFTGACNDF